MWFFSRYFGDVAWNRASDLKLYLEMMGTVPKESLHFQFEGLSRMSWHSYCGIPHLFKSLNSENFLLSLTKNFLWFKNARIQLYKYLLAFYLLSLWSMPSWEVLSKAFSKSKNTAPVICLVLKPSVAAWQILRMWSCVLRLRRNPDWHEGRWLSDSSQFWSFLFMSFSSSLLMQLMSDELTWVNLYKISLNYININWHRTYIILLFFNFKGQKGQFCCFLAKIKENFVFRFFSKIQNFRKIGHS
jgi:hypothetical protein